MNDTNGGNVILLKRIVKEPLEQEYEQGKLCIVVNENLYGQSEYVMKYWTPFPRDEGL